MLLLNLFLCFSRIGLFAIGGAYSFLPLIEREVVQRYHWLTKEEFLDVLGLVKIFPGAISIKYAAYTGYKVAGIPGALAANLGNLLAPLVLVIFGSVLYSRYKNLAGIQSAFNMIQLVVFSLLIAVAFELINIQQLIQFKSLLVIVISFIIFIYTRIHPALIIIIAGVLGVFLK